VDLRRLEVWVEVVGGKCARGTGLWAQSGRIRENRTGRIGEDSGGLTQHTGLITVEGICLEDSGVDNATVIDAVATTNHCVGITRNVIGEANTWADIIFVARHKAAIDRGRRPHGNRGAGGSCG